MRRAIAIVAVSVAVTGLGGCSPDPHPLPVERIKSLVTELGGNPDRYYEANVAHAPLDGQRLRTQKIYLVPVGPGREFRILDADGAVYQDYRDFLRNNTLGE